jgi:hypothetical protein
MKKLVYFFLTILIVGCSSDDESNTSQTFLEKYAGVVWEYDQWDTIDEDEQEGYWRYIIFDNRDKNWEYSPDVQGNFELNNGFFTRYEADYDGTFNCYTAGEFSNDEGSISIEMNSDNVLKFRWVEIDQENGSTIVDTSLITLTAINNGTTLESTDSLFPGEVGTWSRVNISNPCE